jgi:hypothetical protein
MEKRNMTNKPQVDPRMPPGYGKAAPALPPPDQNGRHPAMVFLIAPESPPPTMADDAPLFNTAPPPTAAAKPAKKK